MSTNINVNGINEIDFSLPGTTSATLTPGVVSIVNAGFNGVNSKTATYTIASTDNEKLVKFSSGSGVVANLPQPGTSSIDGNFVVWIANVGAGSVTITPASSQIDGGATLSLTTNQGVIIFNDGTNYWSVRGISSGGVTSVSLVMPAEFSVAGSPITSSGTFTVTKQNESANQVWAGPTSGGAAVPTFRSLVSADIPIATTSLTGAVVPDNSSITISGGVISATAGTGGTTIGARASLPVSVPAKGNTYYCTDSPYVYVSDGTHWQGFLGSIEVGDLSVNAAGLTLVTVGTNSPTITTDITAGGYKIRGTTTGDNIAAVVTPVTPSSTLKLSFGAIANGQVGPVIWNTNNGRAIICRFVAPNIFNSRYNIAGGLNLNAGNVAASNLWPSQFFYGLTFDGTNWSLGFYADAAMQFGIGTAIFTEALTTFIGTNYTHVGAGGNTGTTYWIEHFRLVSP